MLNKKKQSIPRAQRERGRSTTSSQHHQRDGHSQYVPFLEPRKSGNRRELPPVCLEDLKGIFSGRDFGRGIGRAQDIGTAVGHESQFTFWRPLRGGKIVHFPIQANTVHGTPVSTALEMSDVQVQMIEERQLVPLLLYHYHGSLGVGPSETDLTEHICFRKQYGYICEGKSPIDVEIYPLDCIGAPSEAGQQRHDVLVYQSRCSSADLLEGEVAYDQIRRQIGRGMADSVRIAEVLDSISYWNAVLLRYQRQGRIYTLSEDQLSALERFTYTPAFA